MSHILTAVATVFAHLTRVLRPPQQEPPLPRPAVNIGTGLLQALAQNQRGEPPASFDVAAAA